MAKKIFGSVENGLNRKQYEMVVDFVEKMIFDGCGGRKLRTMYLIETGKMFKKGRVSSLKIRSYYISTKYRDISPITNMDRIIHNILNVVANNDKYPAWMKDKEQLRRNLNSCLGLVVGF